MKCSVLIGQFWSMTTKLILESFTIVKHNNVVRCDSLFKIYMINFDKISKLKLLIKDWRYRRYLTIKVDLPISHNAFPEKTCNLEDPLISQSKNKCTKLFTEKSDSVLLFYSA